METIAAIATPLATGGVAMIRISGSEAIAVAERVFRTANGTPLQALAGYTAAYGAFCNEEEQLDDGIALVFRAPRSYTGEDVVELSCHGGIYSTRAVLRLVLDHGARMAEAGEFSKRAFLNGKMSLTQAEAVIDLINARSEQSLKAAKSQMDGALYHKIEAVKQQLLHTAAHLAAWVDYPEEDIEELELSSLLQTLEQAKQVTGHLLETFDTGKILREGVETAIVGRPNVGKSTLMNLMAGCEKSIVTDIAGTTRDVVEECVQVGDALLRLADTAGIRETEDVVEQYGVKRAYQRMETAGLILAVFDSSVPFSSEDQELMEHIQEQHTPAIAIWHKTDLPTQGNEEYLQKYFKHIVYTTKNSTDSISLLAETIAEVLQLHQLDLSEGLLANERQRSCAVQADAALLEAVEALQMGMTLDAVTVSIDSALEALLALSGERVTDSVVDQVFHNFCVGK